MKTTEIISKWYANLYDQEEIQTEDVRFMLSMIGREPQNILEVCCGSGRILVPLAEEGHTVTGFDMDDYMLERIPSKAQGLENINYFKADAIVDDWGNNFDTVILAGNILINIEAEIEYKDAQKLFIKKAYNCLRPNGHLYLDFSLFSSPENIFNCSETRTIFEGTDSSGNYGKFTISDSTYNEQNQISSFKRKFEITSKDNEKMEKERIAQKYIPKLLQVQEWLYEAGFKVISQYGDYDGSPISENTNKAIIWAEKVR